MASAGYAIYNPNRNQLDVIRPGENTTRHISCTNLNPAAVKVHGVQINGDEIWVLVGGHTNPRPNRKLIYKFSSLSGGGSTLI